MNTVTVIPAVRVSEQVQPEFRVFSHEADALQIDVLRGGCILLGCTRKLTPGKTSVFHYSLKGAVGDVELRFRFYRGEKEVETSSAPYQVVPGSVPATGLIDGCWISICHWSEQEAVFFNSELKKMRDEDFERHIEEMSLLGIRGVVIQNVFDSSHYVGRHEMTCGSYDGREFYPSGLYPGRMPLAARDPIEAVLRAADRCGMHVLLGVGLFAWFDFSEQSLEWHRRVARELFQRYGGHASFYGWYVSEEIMGDLYYSYMPHSAERWKELAVFFREFRTFVQELAPTKPVAFAPNNVRFHLYAEEWKTILPFIDILIPFAFARDPEHLNVVQMKQICDECGTHMWVDMEMFREPFEDGLVPKTMEALLREIRQYDALEQCYGYQYTGLMNHPASRFSLGGEPAKELYARYLQYYQARRAAWGYGEKQQ